MKAPRVFRIRVFPCQDNSEMERSKKRKEVSLQGTRPCIKKVQADPLGGSKKRCHMISAGAPFTRNVRCPNRHVSSLRSLRFQRRAGSATTDDVRRAGLSYARYIDSALTVQRCQYAYSTGKTYSVSNVTLDSIQATPLPPCPPTLQNDPRSRQAFVPSHKASRNPLVATHPSFRRRVT